MLSGDRRISRATMFGRCRNVLSCGADFRAAPFGKIYRAIVVCNATQTADWWHEQS
jgi:hypothetical protein